MSLKSVPGSLRATRWPTVSWRTLCFLGGFSFLGFWFLPPWLMAPLFFLTPAFGPLLLALAGFLAGIALTFVRFQLVPQSHGVFLKGFAASGSALRLPGKLLDRHGQKDLNETLGDKPRSLHEPVALIGDDSLWLMRRSQQDAS